MPCCNPFSRKLRLSLYCACLGTALSLAAQSSPDPDLLVYEGFDYDAGSSIEQLDGGTGWSTPWLWRQYFVSGGTIVTNSAIVEPGSLTYGKLAVSGNHVRLTGANGELQLGRGFAEAIGGEAGTSTYISYVGQRVGPLADPSSSAYGGNYPWGNNLYPRGTSLRFWNTGERLSIGNYSNQNQNAWAIYGSGLPILHSNTSFSAETAFVVARVDHKASGGETGDDIYLWVNPAIGEGENISTADIQLLNATEDSSPVHVGSLTWLSPFAGQQSIDSQQRILRPHAELLVDEIRIGRTYASVMPVENRWGGYDKADESNVFTGKFLQWLYLSGSDWNWNYLLMTWQYIPESHLTDDGAWVFVANFAGNPPEGGSGEGFWEGYAIDSNGIVDTGHFLGRLHVSAAPWVWSETLETWINAPTGELSDGSAYVYVLDGNPATGLPPTKALATYPMDGDQHVEISSETVTLQWRAGQRADSHDVYYGTDLQAITGATPESEEFLGNFTESSLALTGDFYSGQLSYWRVDAINESGVTTGDVWSFRPAQLAFPGAEGWGRFALGGRHGRVVHVTNLNDNGPGSLRAAIEDEAGPRIVVFDVGGLITLESDITIRDTDTEVTVAGQTAPYPGITIRKNKFGISGGRDVVMRFLRLKLGNIAEETSDGTGMQGSDHCIMDHMSVGWSIDEAFSSRNAKNITLQRTMLEEALNEAGHKNYPEGSRHGYAASVGGDIASFHHNFLAHCAGRNWSMAGGLSSGAYAGRLDFTNNVVYNWDGRTTDGGAHEVNFVGNYYKGGPATNNLNFLNPQHEKAGTGTQRYFVAGNVMDMEPIPGINDRYKQVGPENQEEGYTTDAEFPDAYVDEPFFENHVATHSARLAYKRVLSDVGANQPSPDDHDYRIIGEALGRTFTYRGSKTNFPGLIDNENDLGDPWVFYDNPTARPEGFDTDEDGLPDWYEGIIGTNTGSPTGDFSDMRADPDSDGFTHMDDYLAWLAAPHVDCPADGSVEVDLAALSRGFTDSPVFNIVETSNGVAVVLPDGVSARFTPDPGFTGLAQFTFTVTDAQGDTLTRHVGVRTQ